MKLPILVACPPFSRFLSFLCTIIIEPGNGIVNKFFENKGIIIK